jgi:hypothetical protein
MRFQIIFAHRDRGLIFCLPLSDVEFHRQSIPHRRLPEAPAMWHSVQIEVDGSLVGAAVRQQNGVRFIATDVRVAELDQTLWSATADAREAAEQMVRTGHVRNFNPQSIED